MAVSDKRILVVGGGSRIAAALVPLLGPQASFVARRVAGLPNERLVGDYGSVPSSFFANTDCVVNCVGVSTGAAAMLERVNVAVALNLARTARAAGVRRFIQISSFSVYGHAAIIHSRTSPRPIGNYGLSKLKADTELLALGTESFSPILLRLPLIYDHDSLGKLGQLLRLWTWLRLLPVPKDDVERAMISANLVAEVVARLRHDSCKGVVFAADPEPFTYAKAAAARIEKLGQLPLPALTTRALTRAMPSLGRRLFSNSSLAGSDNLAICYELASRLYGDIATADLR